MMPKFIVKPSSSNTYVVQYQYNGMQTIHGRSPYPNEETGTWFFFDDQEEKFIDSGIPCRYDDTKILERLKDIEEQEEKWNGKQDAGDYLLPSDIATSEEFTDYLGIPRKENQDGGEQVDDQ